MILEALAENADDDADEIIRACLDLNDPKSFFLFAGAGSGKTRSLVNALKHVQESYGDDLRNFDKRIGVITFTNAACDEIKRRLSFDPLIEVSTIHSFAWTLIGGFNRDIREWLRINLAQEITVHQADEAKGRKGTKASAERLAKIESKTRRLARLDEIRHFTYSPTGDNSGRAALNHAEVIKITASFLQTKKNLRTILINRYPILLIDESQDTHGDLISAFFAVQVENAETFCLGLFGDTMQRIYTDGKADLGVSLPEDWKTPMKRLNHRCPRRVIALINKIRSAVDTQSQHPTPQNPEGSVRLFILPSDTENKAAAEQAVADAMAILTGDEAWKELSGRKSLTLEHRMAARRMGFEEMFVPLHGINNFRTGLLDGSLPATRIFANEALPLIRAQQRGDKFAVARILRKVSPLLSAQKLREASNQPAHMAKVREAVAALTALWNNGHSPTFRDVLTSLSATGLLSLPPSLAIAAATERAEEFADPSGDDVDQPSEKTAAIEAFLNTPFDQIEPYALYISGNGPFDTHQGVKGLEFPRVMVIMDDAEARGFSFKYDKLFGGGTEDSTLQSTRRLFYVTCSRAEKSLALIAYTSDAAAVRSAMISNGWFEDQEIQIGV